MMRILTWKTCLIGAFLTNFIIGFIMWLNLDKNCNCSNFHETYTSYIRAGNQKHRLEISSINDSDVQLSSKALILVREFEYFENDLPDTVKSIRNILPTVKILIIADKIPYPPLQLPIENDENIHIISLKQYVGRSFEYTQPFNLIDKEHIFIVPDSLRMENLSQMIAMMEAHNKNPKTIIAAPIDGENLSCLSLNVSLRHWTIKYGINTADRYCNVLEGMHVVLLTKSLLLQFGYPFSRPFTTSLYIQASQQKIKTQVAKGVSFKRGKNLFSNAHYKWKYSTLNTERKHNLYKDFGIKKVIYPASKVEWHGCSKNTARCFGTVINNMPEYLYEKRWTPPCCLENLRQTARYVFTILEKCKVRYWLEGGSLLGAVRTNDIIPWDYDVDVGIYKDDIQKCEWLKNSLQQSIVDTQGFLWEKAHEGDFIRVQFSQTNHLHVDIFPFYSRNGTMTKNTWFPSHKQDTEFPEHYLKPLYKIKFIGVVVSAPNNYRKFLEFKFGKGVIENPEYPDSKVLKFPK
ncbi:Fukutin-related protein, partial [Stegodyphus mimosarum]